MSTSLPHTILAQAVDWYVRLHDSAATEATRNGWQDWLAADPRHAQAWARVERLQQRFKDTPPGLAGTLEQARHQRRAAIKLLALLLGVGVVGWQGYRVSPLSADYVTRSGQRRQAILADGSRLELNTDSRVDVLFDAGQRLIHLRQGEILVDTAKDARPLSVQTAEGRILALGTRFTVRQEPGLTLVAVEADAVEVRPRRAQQLQRVEAGQALTFSADSLGPLHEPDSNASAWTRGMLIVSDWRLDDFLGELARYRPGHLGCAPEVAGLRLSGAFTLDDTDAVLANLQDSLPVRIRYLTRFWVRVEGKT